MFGLGQKKKTFRKKVVSRNAGDEKNLNPGDRKFIFLIDFPGIFSFLLQFLLLFLILAFFYLFVCCVFEIKMYILIHTRLSERVSDKKIFTRPIFFFFWPWMILISFDCYIEIFFKLTVSDNILRFLTKFANVSENVDYLLIVVIYFIAFKKSDFTCLNQFI